MTATTHPSLPRNIPRILLLCTFACLLAGASPRLQAQTQTPIIPLATCVEYPAAYPYDYIAHFGYFNSNGSDVTIATSEQNFFTPVTSPQFNTFAPGYHSDVASATLPRTLAETWHLDGYTISSSSFFDDPSGNGVLEVAPNPNPVCPVAFVPASPAFTAPGTYTHQFLGQVNSGPAADGNTFALTGVVLGSTDVSIANVTYVPSDAASPAGGDNKNSIYGDITITNSTGVAVNILVQLTVNGVVLTDGTVTITD